MTIDLSRFVDAQEFTFQQAIDELTLGRKRSHWIWFVFPQLYGLGHSEASKKYGIRNIGEAEAYLRHPTLGLRLIEATTVVFESKTHPCTILGELDYQKFISCMTLFMMVTPKDSIFASILHRFSTIDQATQNLLRDVS